MNPSKNTRIASTEDESTTSSRVDFGDPFGRPILVLNRDGNNSNSNKDGVTWCIRLVSVLTIVGALVVLLYYQGVFGINTNLVEYEAKEKEVRCKNMLSTGECADSFYNNKNNNDKSDTSDDAQQTQNAKSNDSQDVTGKSNDSTKSESTATKMITTGVEDATPESECKDCCETIYHFKNQSLGAAYNGVDKEIMSEKTYGTCPNEPDANLMRWSVQTSEVSRVCCKNRHWAELKHSFESIKDFWDELEKVRGSDDLYDKNPKNSMTFYDSITQKPLYVAPKGRSWNDFIEESKDHGWPSFRNEETIQANVRILPEHNGEIVSVDGTHLGHNLPDWKGPRHCINLVSVAAKKKEC